MSLNILETTYQIFLIFCAKLGHLKGTNVTEARFLKKRLGKKFQDVTNEDKHSGGIIEDFCPYLKIQSSELSKHLAKSTCLRKSGSGCLLETRPLFETWSFFVYFRIMTVVMLQSEQLEIWSGCTI